jgi:hypothetical protein
MNTVLVVLACMAGRYCSEEPIYAVVYIDEKTCQQAVVEVSNSVQAKQRGVKARCVPEVKVPKL